MELYVNPLFSDANLKAYYRFLTGFLTADSKNGYTLTSHGSPTPITGRYNGGVNFNVSTDYYSRASAWTSSGQAFSIIVWARNYFGAMHSSPTPGTTLEWYFSKTATILALHTAFTDDTAPSDSGTFPSPYDDTVWHQFAVTIGVSGGNTTVKMYLDSVLFDTTLHTGKLPHAVETAQYISFYAVEGKNGSTGDLDEFAFFNREITATELQRLYRAQSGFFVGGVV